MDKSLLNVQIYLRNNSLQKLCEELFIKVQRHKKYPNLVNFCYSQIDSPKTHPIVLECRGLILDENNNWEVVAYPFSRFFNYGEGGAAEIDWANASTFSKLDGSLIILYHYNQEWHLATKGTPDASGEVNKDYEFTFAELAWKVFEEDENYSTTQLNPNFTYLFELCTSYNKIIVTQKKNQLILIGVRDNQSGQEQRIEEYKHLFHIVETHNLNSWKSIQDYLLSLNGYHQEGYVVLDHQTFGRVKIKHPVYVALSSLKQGLTKNKILEIIRTNESDEFLLYFPEHTGLYNELKVKYDQLVQSITFTFNQYKDISDKKEFALAVKDFSYSSIVFSLKSNQITSVKQGLATMNIEKLLNLIEAS